MSKLLLNSDFALIWASGLLSVYLLATNRLPARFKPIAVALIISAVEELLALYFAYKIRDSITVYFITNPLDYAAFGWFFCLNINYPPAKKLIKTTVIIFICIFWGSLYFYVQYDSLIRSIIKDYEVVIRGILLAAWSVVCIFNIFDQINKSKKLNMLVLIITASILFYYTYTIILFLTEIYLFKYSADHHIPLAEMFSAKNTNMYASRQYHALWPLNLAVIFLFNIVLFASLIKVAFFSKKQYSV